MISDTPLTEEMVENTKSFYEYARELAWKRTLEKRRSMLNWFYDPNFISEKQPPTEYLTEVETDFIEFEVSKSFHLALTGETYAIDWFTPWWYIIKKKGNGLSVKLINDGSR